MLQLVETLHHKKGDSWFDCRWSPWKSLSDLILLSAFHSPVFGG